MVDRLMLVKAAPTIDAGPEQNLPDYAASLLERFANSALNHRLAQIAMDGSEKIPQRWLETLAAQGRAGIECPAILTALAAWLRHVRGDDGTVDDPSAAQFAELWRTADAAIVVHALFGAGGRLAARWHASAPDCTALIEHLSRSAT